MRSAMLAIFAALLCGAALLSDSSQEGKAREGPSGGAGPKPGEKAPDFKLPRLDPKSPAVQLSSFQGRSPVVLVFGSYT